ncbi:hypothetical protein ASPZODRAFT_263089 [Penicilliopsis zonata CBS 506.65]|uniref:Uncharacterized protein n=1 Tax=Penicilliopsis zonata CBS 506.65 TaxID=1073090 RepID=A0A1L9SU92_9EURO|nr:hypothetical protein ASPZODRAFT_263089 [Penicilliopsis zonata CBS 506.65]OJJ50785.1 hypothetical protein ASPZODRAFT_263089 [Penicilliopsis zonata CBS 506.65]
MASSPNQHPTVHPPKPRKPKKNLLPFRTSSKPAKMRVSTLSLALLVAFTTAAPLSPPAPVENGVGGATEGLSGSSDPLSLPQSSQLEKGDTGSSILDTATAGAEGILGGKRSDILPGDDKEEGNPDEYNPAAFGWPSGLPVTQQGDVVPSGHPGLEGTENGLGGDSHGKRGEEPSAGSSESKEQPKSESLPKIDSLPSEASQPVEQETKPVEQETQPVEQETKPVEQETQEKASPATQPAATPVVNNYIEYPAQTPAQNEQSTAGSSKGQQGDQDTQGNGNVLTGDLNNPLQNVSLL